MPAVRLTRTPPCGIVGRGNVPLPAVHKKGYMSTSEKNINERLIDRIDAVLSQDIRFDRYSFDDESVLIYIRASLRPEELAKREADPFNSSSVTHLHEVAKMRLRPYEESNV